MTSNLQELLASTGQSRQSIEALVGALARFFSKMPTGDIAQLRRTNSRDPSSPAFWKIAAAYLEPAGVLPVAEAARFRAERSWATILSAMAHLVSLHSPRVPLGAALAESGLSELRFSRLLRARDDALSRMAGEIAHFLAAKAQPVDLAGLARLILSDNRRNAEAVRREIARDYFRVTSKS